MIQTTYSDAREHLADLWDRVINDREVIRLTRRGTSDVALIAADELEGLLETVYLLRSPANARILRDGIARAETGVDQQMTLDELCHAVGLPNDAE
jgi:antitoxin YefM